jgi:hypothetical protein
MQRENIIFFNVPFPNTIKFKKHKMKYFVNKIPKNLRSIDFFKIFYQSNKI